MRVQVTLSCRYDIPLQVLIIEGETGSGKTTQLPQYLYEAVSVIALLLRFEHVVQRLLKGFLQRRKEDWLHSAAQSCRYVRRCQSR